jgi:predicted DNA-binding transcriptional regulator AlpA
MQTASPAVELSVGSPLLNVSEAARYLALSEATLNKWRVTGAGPAHYKMSTRIGYRRDDLDAWLASRRRNSTADAGVEA